MQQVRGIYFVTVVVFTLTFCTHNSFFQSSVGENKLAKTRTSKNILHSKLNLGVFHVAVITIFVNLGFNV